MQGYDHVHVVKFDSCCLSEISNFFDDYECQEIKSK